MQTCHYNPQNNVTERINELKVTLWDEGVLTNQAHNVVRRLQLTNRLNK